MQGKHTKKRNKQAALDSATIEQQQYLAGTDRQLAEERALTEEGVEGAIEHTEQRILGHTHTEYEPRHNHPYSPINHGHPLSDLSGVARQDHGVHWSRNEIESIAKQSAPALPARTSANRVPASGAPHSHSISSSPFIKLSKGERGRMLHNRTLNHDLLTDLQVPLYVRVMAAGVEDTYSLFMDYRDLDAYERERRFEDPEWTEWTEAYKKIYGVDEYAEEDRNNYLSYGEYRMDPYEGIALS